MEYTVGVKIVPTEQEAEIVCSFLRVQGIGCFWRRTNYVAIDHGMPVGAALEIAVAPEAAELARELLADVGRA